MLLQIFLNILAFVPLGLLLPIVFPVLSGAFCPQPSPGF